MIGLLDWVGPVFIIFMLVGIFLFRSYLMTQADRKRRKQAIKASAQIIQVGHSRSSEKYQDIVVDMTIEVNPPNGIPYPVQVKWRVNPVSASKLQVGNSISVKIDLSNPQLIFSAEKGIQDMNH